MSRSKFPLIEINEISFVENKIKKDLMLWRHARHSDYSHSSNKLYIGYNIFKINLCKLDDLHSSAAAVCFNFCLPVHFHLTDLYFHSNENLFIQKT